MMQDDTLSLLGLAGLEARQWGFSEEDRQRQELRELREEVEQLKGGKKKEEDSGNPCCCFVLLCVAAYWFFRNDKAKKDDGEEWKE